MSDNGRCCQTCGAGLAPIARAAGVVLDPLARYCGPECDPSEASELALRTTSQALAQLTTYRIALERFEKHRDADTHAALANAENRLCRLIALGLARDTGIA